MVIPSPYSPFILQTSLFSIRWYGLLIAFGIIFSYLLILRKIRTDKKISESTFDALFLVAVVSGVVGARLGYVLQNLDLVAANLLFIIRVWDGGLSIHGAIILAVIAIYFFARKNKLAFLELFNLLTPYLLLGAAIGRWGNYFNQEIIGRPASGFFKLEVDPIYRPAGYETINYFHPVFLYESLLMLASFTIFLLWKKKLENYGFLFALVAYNLIRIVVEFFRIDYKPIFLTLDLAQWVSFGIIVFAILLGLTFRKK